MNKKDIRDEIEKIVANGDLQSGKALVEEYKKNFNNDSEIASIESVIYFYNGQLDKSLEVVREGLKYNLFNSDLYSIMGSIFEQKGDWNRAFLCYEQALYYCKEEENKQVLLSNISTLYENHTVSVNKVSFIILTYNNLSYTKQCIESIRNNVNKNTYEIIVVDNNSSDDTVEWLKKQNDIITLFNHENAGFPGGCNQGIVLASKENDIILLNNDTIVMPNSIFNLRMGLYSNENVGAVGAVSNSVAYYQRVHAKIDSEKEYQEFILKNNIPNDNFYEERTKLIGFAYMIKRNILNKVGLLDERFYPGNFEDDDLSLRIINANYKLLLCKDAFIHHYGSVSFRNVNGGFDRLLIRNEEKFMDKWGFSSQNTMIMYKLTKLFVKKEDKNILEINCGAGSNLLNIRNEFKDKTYYATEENKSLVPIVKALGINYIDTYKDDKYLNFFDMIIIRNYSLCNDEEFLKEIHKYLVKDTGRIVCNLDAYLEGKESIEISKVNNFKNKFFENKFDVEYLYQDKKDNEVYYANICFNYLNDAKIEAKLNTYLDDGRLTKALSYISRVKSYGITENIINIKDKVQERITALESIKFALRRAELKNEDVPDTIFNVIRDYSVSDKALIQLVDDNMINKVFVYNFLAIAFFGMKVYDRVLPYLNEAYKIDDQDVDTVYNLGFILNFIGQKEKALSYLESLKNKNEEVTKLICEIKGV